jgi:hypothetical protein
LIIKCQACGMTNHARKQCAFKHHELVNNTSLPWDNSPKGKMWASHGKSHLTIGYAIPGHPAIQHSDGIYPKPNPYAKSHYQSNSSTGRYRQDNYNRDLNNNYNRDQTNNNYNGDNNNNNRNNSVGRNTNTNSGTNYNNNSRENSVGRNNNNNNSDSNTRIQSYFDNVNKQNRNDNNNSNKYAPKSPHVIQDNVGRGNSQPKTRSNSRN